MTEPPGPPLPPSGPPSGLNFSRCTEATPLPPRPALMNSVTWSTNVGTAMASSRWCSGVLRDVLGEMAKGAPIPGTPFDQAVVQAGCVRSLARDDVDHATTATRAE